MNRGPLKREYITVLNHFQATCSFRRIDYRAGPGLQGWNQPRTVLYMCSYHFRRRNFHYGFLAVFYLIFFMFWGGAFWYFAVVGTSNKNLSPSESRWIYLCIFFHKAMLSQVILGTRPSRPIGATFWLSNECVTDRQTDKPTDGLSQLWRCFVAPKNR